MKTRALNGPAGAALMFLLALTSAARPGGAQNATPRADSAADFSRVPGVVIAHAPASSKVYLGSPGIAILANGSYVAKCDEFGHGIEQTRALTRVFGSTDKGRTWRALSVVSGSFWSTIFVHHGALYLLGTDREYGRVVIHRSDDGGSTWSTPRDGSSGVLRSDGKFHCAPVPVVEHAGRLWRAMEDAEGPGGWGSHFRAFMMSAPLGSDLLKAGSWTSSNPLQRDARWNGGDFGGWLEGNAVVTPQGKLVDILRVDTVSPDEKAAVVQLSADGRTASFDPGNGLIPFPGGAKKFTIRFDPRSRKYWSLATIVPQRHRAQAPGGIRNTLALTCSSDLKTWAVRSIVLYHPDTARHGFQYVDWLFEGDDIIAACRTAYDDAEGGAHNNHDANFLTFHRLKNFRALTMADSVAMPEPAASRVETPAFILTGRAFELARLEAGARSFSNRDYVWAEVPAAFAGGRFTRLSGGEGAQIVLKAKRDATLFIATALALPGVKLDGWKQTGAALSYNDAGNTSLAVLSRELKAGQEVAVPQGNWTGTLVLLPTNEK